MMWKSLFFLTILSKTVNGYLLSKSDPICRDDSFLFYWKSMNPNLKGATPYDITNDCCALFQTWFMFILAGIFLVWILQLIPIVVNFIEGSDRRTKCCDEKKKKEKKKNHGKGDE